MKVGLYASADRFRRGAGESPPNAVRVKETASLAATAETENIVTKSIYEHLVSIEDARACRDIPDSACHVVPRNFSYILFSYTLTKIGDALTNPKTVLTWVLVSVQAPLFLVGLLVPIRESGALLPQLVIAAYVRRLPVRKWTWVAGSILQALAIFGIGLVAVLFRGWLAGVLVLTCLVFFSLARGLSSVATKDVVGKTIPKGERGQLSGWSESLAGLVTLAIGGVLALGLFSGTRGYGIALMLAGTLWLVAAAVYSRVSEMPGETDGGANALGKALGSMSLLRDDKPFARFVTARALLMSSGLTAPFIVALAQARMPHPEAGLGWFLFAGGLASLLSAPTWGRMADRSSRRTMQLAGAIASVVAAGVVTLDLLAPEFIGQVTVLPIAFFVLGIAHAGVRVGRSTYITDLAGGNKRTDYVAVSNTVIGLLLLLTGLAGSLAAMLSVSLVIAVYAVMGAMGAWVCTSLPETAH